MGQLDINRDLRERFLEYAKNIKGYYAVDHTDIADFSQYAEFMLRKVKHQQAILNGNIAIEIEPIDNDMYFSIILDDLKKKMRKEYPASDFYRNMTRALDYKFSDNDPFINAVKILMEDENKKIEEFVSKINTITVEELKTNSLMVNRMHEGRRYDAGMKVTKFLGKLGINERVYASIQFDYDKVKRPVILSVDPGDIAFGGRIGESCYSPDGSNSHSLAATIRYDQSFIAVQYLENGSSWRAWVYVDNKHKRYFVASGHPFENLINQLTVHSYFESLGYTLANEVDVNDDIYLDSNSNSTAHSFFYKKEGEDDKIINLSMKLDYKGELKAIPRVESRHILDRGGAYIPNSDEEQDEEYYEEDEENDE